MNTSLELFFTSLFPSLKRGQYIEIRAIAPNWFKTNVRAKNRFCSSIREAIDTIHTFETEPAPWNIYFGVLPRTGRRGSRDAIHEGSVIWVDIDAKNVGDKETAFALVRQTSRVLGANPRYLIDSANGAHSYWSLPAPVDGLAVESLNHYVAALCCGDTVYDASRVLRVPGTLNTKNQPFGKCRIIECSDDLLSETFVKGILGESQKPKTFQQRGSRPSQDQITPLPFSLDNIDPLRLEYIYRGIQGDIRGYYTTGGKPDKSKLDFAIVLYLLRQGWSSGQIYGLFTNPKYRISEKTLEKPPKYQQKYLQLTISKAKALL